MNKIRNRGGLAKNTARAYTIGAELSAKALAVHKSQSGGLKGSQKLELDTTGLAAHDVVE